MIRNQEQVFEDIYRQEKWGKGKGSGTGSDPKYCEKYLDYLTLMLNHDTEQHDVKSVIDIGCGDWQLYKGFQWPNDIKYIGCDISQTAIDIAKTRTTQIVLKVDTMDDTLNLIEDNPNDLILIKDVMQHWTDEEINYFLNHLKNLPGWKYVLISNNWKFHRDPTKNGQPRMMDKYSWAPIPVDHPVLVEFGFKLIFRYPKGGFKQVMLSTRGEVQ
jgi:2-polyprenyl-3-methyl-5-hydroxy-6-metoxy-1,4-benzoquinol methylase